MLKFVFIGKIEAAFIWRGTLRMDLVTLHACRDVSLITGVIYVCDMWKYKWPVECDDSLALTWQYK